MVGDLPQAVTESALARSTDDAKRRSDCRPTSGRRRRLCGLAMLLALVATWKGPGLSNDSVTYLSAGVNIAGSHGMTRLDERR